MGIIIEGMHVYPDVWVLHIQGKRTGFRFLTPKGLAWAKNYKEMQPDEYDKMLWVPEGIGAGIMEDLSSSHLHVLYDPCEEDEMEHKH